MSGLNARVGQIVGYVLDEGRNKGDVRPAIIVHVWEAEETGCSQLQVFMDGDGGPYNDGTPNVVWQTSILHNADKEPGTWHFLE